MTMQAGTAPANLKAYAPALISRAVLAPSSHNTQPWRFVVSETAIDLWMDRRRALPVNDPQGRELVISCGCALMNLRVAAARARMAVVVRSLPSPQGQPEWLARVTVGRDADGHPDGIQSDDVALADFLGRRHTCRGAFIERDVDASVVATLAAAARQEGVGMDVIPPGVARDRLARCVAQGDETQWANPAWRDELATWMHSRQEGDGLTLPSLWLPLVRTLVRTFNMGGRVGASHGAAVRRAPCIVVLSTEGDHPTDWLRTGQALERVLLQAAGLGLQAAFFNQPVQVEPLRSQLQPLAGGAYPQMVLGLGYPRHEQMASPRRALSDSVGA
jgi:hypothetical protein